MIDITLQYLEKGIELLKNTNTKIYGTKDGELVAFYLLSEGIIDSSYTVLQLIKNKKLRDSYIIARAIFDHALNIGYFSAKGNKVVEKAYNHSLSKSYRDLRRKIEIGDIKFSIGLSEDIEIKQSERLTNALEEFTNQKGHEIRSWTDDNTFAKIKAIDNKFDKGISLPFSMCLYYIYRHSSEIIHGTLFGAMYARGMTQERNEWPNTEEEFDEYIEYRLTLLGQSILLLISSTIYIIGYHYDLGDIKKLNKDIITEFKNRMKASG